MAIADDRAALLAYAGAPSNSIELDSIFNFFAGRRPALTALTSTLNTSGNNLIINTQVASGYQVGYAIHLVYIDVHGTTASGNTITIKSGTGTNLISKVCSGVGEGLSILFPPNRELVLAAEDDLYINLATTEVVRYSVVFFLDAPPS